jgi:uncharacterized membrane protein
VAGVGLTILFGAVFLACSVEAVEALTVVLAVGMTRDWRSTWQGTAAGVAVLAVIVVVLGQALVYIPIGTLRLVVGALLLVFGLQWLRKAILRAAGVIAQRDEEAAFRRTVSDAATGAGGPRLAVHDWYAFTVVFKAVLLEGLEVAFIVVTFGAGQRSTRWAAVAALAAIAVVAVVGAMVRGPLATVPENTMKFAVGVLLTTFGVFWSGEGAGAEYPWGDAFILVMLAVVLATSLGTVALLRRHVLAAVR